MFHFLCPHPAISSIPLFHYPHFVVGSGRGEVAGGDGVCLEVSSSGAMEGDGGIVVGGGR